MRTDDVVLLEEWIEHRDAQAFREIASRYTGMVYAVCRRMLRNTAEAEDAAQECFEVLSQVRKAPGAHVGAWLHRVAVNRSLNRLRFERNRVAREGRYAQALETTREPGWNDLYAYVDEAIADLPEKLRIPLVANFLDNESQESIAETLGVSRQTVSYRVNKAIERVRKTLTRRGIPIEAAALAALLKANFSEAAPVALLSTLGKLAVAGPSAAMAAPHAVAAGSAFLAAKILAGIAVVVLGAWGVSWTLSGTRGTDHLAPASTQTAPLPALDAEAMIEPPPDEPAEVAKADAGVSVNLQDPRSIWKQVMQVNRPWLNPGRKDLSYTLNMADGENGPREVINTVKVSGNRALIDMEDVQRDAAHTRAVFGDGKVAYLAPSELAGKFAACRNLTRFRQGMVLRTAMHELARAVSAAVEKCAGGGPKVKHPLGSLCRC